MCLKSVKRQAKAFGIASFAVYQSHIQSIVDALAKYDINRDVLAYSVHIHEAYLSRILDFKIVPTSYLLFALERALNLLVVEKQSSRESR